MSDLPRFSVIVPLYNGSAYLAETLDSLLRQTYLADQILLIDDGSTDRSGEIARSFSGPIEVITRTNHGVCETRNFGTARARNEWVHFLDQDDVWEPNHLELQARTIAAHAAADACYSSRRHLKEQKEGGFSVFEPLNLPDGSNLLSHMIERCPFQPSSVAIRRAVLLACGGFDQSFAGVEDWDLWVRLLQSGATFVHNPAATVLYRIHGAANTNNPLPLLRKGTRLVNETILPHLPVPVRAQHGSRVISRLEAEAAILLRENNLPGALPLMLRSIVRNPLHETSRYKIALNMLLKGNG